MEGGPRRRRARAWAWVYAALFGPGDDRNAEGADERSSDGSDGEGADERSSDGSDAETRGGGR